MKVAVAAFCLSETPIFMNKVEQHYGKTYVRVNAGGTFKDRELMAYGGDSGTMNRDHFTEIEMASCVFGKKVLRLDNVCWMNPGSIVEHVPASWAKINVFAYHARCGRARLQETYTVIKVRPQSADKVAAFTLVLKQLVDVNKVNSMPDGQITQMPLVTIEVPESLRQDGPYSLQLVFLAESGSWKSGWAWEGFGVTNATD